jgi:protein TonB
MKNAVSAPPLFATQVGLGAPKRGWTLPVAVAIHGLLAALAVIGPLLGDEPLPPAGPAPRAFFVTPAYAPPAPPPPPPPAARTEAPPVEPTETSGDFVAPVEVPETIADSAGLDFGIEGGVPGGVEGGVPGGVVGGIVGGVLGSDAPPPPPPAIRVGGVIQEPRKVKHVPPVYPRYALAARIQGVVILECTIDPQGGVQGVQVLRGVRLLDEAAVEAVKQWVYTPTLVDGVPMPVLMTVTVNFRLEDSRSL